MKKVVKVVAAVAVALLSGVSAYAAPITITAPNPINDIPSGDPDPTCWGPGIGTDPNFIANFCPAMASLDEIYKFDLPGTESGLAGAYESTANGGATGGTITWTGPEAVDCAFGCWLLVKDGRQNPGRYAYNLSAIWDGVSTITLTGFWPERGGISHWALYGNETELCTIDCGPDRDVPEPGTLALVGLALFGIGASRRIRRS